MLVDGLIYPTGRDKGVDAVVPRLTERELTVLNMLADGLIAGAIARRLDVSPRTVHKHLQNLYRKLGTSDRLGTVLIAQHSGLLDTQK